MAEYWRWKEYRWHDESKDWRSAKFVTAGVDVGSVSSQAVIVADGELFAFSNMRTGSDRPESGAHYRLGDEGRHRLRPLLKDRRLEFLDARDPTSWVLEPERAAVAVARGDVLRGGYDG